jgi:hypothetical protein
MSTTKYNYRSLRDIDRRTLEYLEFVLPVPLNTMSIQQINQYLELLDEKFETIRRPKQREYEDTKISALFH